MAIYRNISTNFWSDTKIYDKFSPEDKYFMLYILTNSYTNLCGCYEISVKQMVNDTGYNRETIEKLLNRLENEYEVISYDNNTQELLIKNWYKYNWTKSNKLDKPLLNEIDSIKSNKFKTFLGKIYNERDTVSIPYPYPMDTTVTDTVSVYNNKLNNNSSSNIDSNNNSNKIKPTIKEIEAYCKERNKGVNAQQFYDYYEINDWKDSKGKPIKNWKQKMIANWENKVNTYKSKSEKLNDIFKKIEEKKKNE